MTIVADTFLRQVLMQMSHYPITVDILLHKYFISKTILWIVLVYRFYLYIY